MNVIGMNITTPSLGVSDSGGDTLSKLNTLEQQISQLIQNMLGSISENGDEGGGSGSGDGGGFGGAPAEGLGCGNGGVGCGGGDFATGSGGGSGFGTAGMTPQSATGALAAYMSEKGIKVVDPNKLYQLATNPPVGTPPDVSAAAQFMLQHPDVYQKLETHDVAGTDGKSGVGNFQWGAQGGLGSAGAGGGVLGAMQSAVGTMSSALGGAAPMTPQSAAGALGAYMSEKGIKDVDPNKLYQLATNPPAGTPHDVSAAAQFMLQHPDVYQKLETHDVEKSDGKSGVGNFQWAAQGGLDSLASAGQDGSSAFGGFSPAMMMMMMQNATGGGLKMPKTGATDHDPDDA